MLMQIGQKPEHDFSEPIGMLEDCHKRILHFMQTLVALTESVGAAPLNADDRDALERSLRYFRESAPRHNSDEEESLFPRLQNHPEAQNGISARISSLAADHRWVEAQHLEIDTIGGRWLSAGVLHPRDHARLRAIIHPLLRFYAHHIEIEEAEVFPAARRLLSATERDAVGREMAERRGLMAPHEAGVLP
ncbi:MAG: hemerythrin domain-containing protein [Terracidiphilus sp.]